MIRFLLVDLDGKIEYKTVDEIVSYLSRFDHIVSRESINNIDSGIAYSWCLEVGGLNYQCSVIKVLA